MTQKAPAKPEVNMHQAKTTFAAARLKAATERPYFSVAFWSMIPVWHPGVPQGLQVDKHWRVYIDPASVIEWGVDKTAGELIHKLGHLLRAHADRARSIGIGDNAESWTKAADAEIDDDLQAEKIVRPHEYVLPEQFGCNKGELAEKYFEVLQAQQQGGGGGKKPPPPGGKGTPPPGGGKGKPQPGKGEGEGNGDRDGHGRPGHSCGSCATDQPADYELPSPGEDGNSPGLSDIESELVRKEVAVQIDEHSRSRGHLPAGWQRWAADRLAPPKLDWRRVVAGLVRRSLAQVMGAVDYTYFKPSRRYNSSEGDGVIMPSLRQPEPKAVVVIDTSGSVSDAMQQRFLEETQGILRACGMKEGARVISVDAEVHTNQKVMNAKNIKLKGGGGTDMCVGIKAAMESKPKPDVVIVLTDGFTPWPQEPIGARLIIGIVGTQYGAAPATPPWAKMVDIDPDDTRASK